MLTGYSGTVTQTASFGCVELKIVQGTLTGGTDYNITCEGNVTQGAGNTIPGDLLSITMTGDSVTFSVSTSNRFHSLAFYGDTTVTSSATFVNLGETLTVDNSVTLTITPGKYLALTYWSATSELFNDGIITGSLILNLYAYDVSLTIGTAENLNLGALNSATANHVFTLDDDMIISGSLSIASNHATKTTTLDTSISEYEISANIIYISTRGVLTPRNSVITTTNSFELLWDDGVVTQGTGVWSFGSYAQTGADSVFNQGATIMIGGDFTVSAGIFNAVGDMTVPGDWDTATGDYANDDNVITLSGTTKTLVMNAADSFFNVTVSGSYTMNTDTTVRLRATISGTLAGTGDFIEPLPEFTSTAWLKVCPLTLYDYEVTQTYWDTLVIVDAPYWLDIYDGHIKGIPGDNETGLYNISLALTWNDMTVYQNYTLIVCPEDAFVTFEFLMYFAAMLILLVINIVGAVVPQVRILTLIGIAGIAILCVPTALVMIDYGYIALVLILVNIIVPVMSTVDNIKDK